MDDQGVVTLVCGDNGKVNKVEKYPVRLSRAFRFSQVGHDSTLTSMISEHGFDVKQKRHQRICHALFSYASLLLSDEKVHSSKRRSFHSSAVVLMNCLTLP